MNRTPLYNPVDKSKSHKQKPSHPWMKWNPGWLQINRRDDTPRRGNVRKVNR